MAIPDWPSTLPYKPQHDNFGRLQHHQSAVTTETEDGPTLQRVQSNTRIKKLSMQLRFDDTQYATWEAFVEETIAQGTAQFTMPVYVAGALGGSSTTRRCYIEGGVWSDTPYGYDTMVSFTLCVFPAE